MRTPGPGERKGSGILGPAKQRAKAEPHGAAGGLHRGQTEGVLPAVHRTRHFLRLFQQLDGGERRSHQLPPRRDGDPAGPHGHGGGVCHFRHQPDFGGQHPPGPGPGSGGGAGGPERGQVRGVRRHRGPLCQRLRPVLHYLRRHGGRPRQPGGPEPGEENPGGL